MYTLESEIEHTVVPLTCDHSPGDLHLADISFTPFSTVHPVLNLFLYWAIT